MTSDAKVGLLLGLVFIFIIAFIINGLPNFYRPTNSNELTTNMVDSQMRQTGIAANERKVYREVIDTRQFTRPAASQTPPADNQVVRFETALPTAPSAAHAPAPELSPAPAPTTRSLAQGSRNWPKKHVVARGETLASIAKKFYGPEEGNRLANIEKIFGANKKLLKSIDHVYQGQKLIIPALTAQAEEPSEAGLAETIFEKVKSIGRRHLSAETEKQKSDRKYVVREGDNLWGIAANELGDGSRYTEIARLNSGILENADSLDVGMRLSLPGR